MAKTNNNQFTAIELGVCSGNNLNALTRRISVLTDNYKYLTTEMPDSFKDSKDIIDGKVTPEIQRHLVCTPETFENIASNGFSTFNGNFDGKADLIVASHCLSFCQRDKFFDFMKNLTGAVKDGGIFMGEIYLDKMDAEKFPYSKEEILALLQGKIDSNGNAISQDENGNPTSKGVFDGFNVKAQMSSGDFMVHFIAEKSKEQGTTFSEEIIVDKSNPKVEASDIIYGTTNKSLREEKKEMKLKEKLGITVKKEEEPHWSEYAKAYNKFTSNIPQDKLTPEIERAIIGFNGVMPPRPLVESFFDSENGQQWLSGRIQRKDTDSNGGENKDGYETSTISTNAQAIVDGIFGYREGSAEVSANETATPQTEENPDMEMFRKLEKGDPYKDTPEQPHELKIFDNSSND